MLFLTKKKKHANAKVQNTRKIYARINEESQCELH